MKNLTFGIDIGNTSIKAVWLSTEGKPALKACMTAPTYIKGMLSESPFDQEKMAETLRKVITDAKITTNYAHVALPDNQVYTKVIDMPVFSEKELSSAIYWEAEQHIPAPLSTITLDHTVLRKQTPQQSSDPKMQVLLVGAPTVLLQKYQRILGLAGISIASVETEMISVIRSIGVGEGFPTSLIVNISALSTSLAIVQNGVVLFMYTVPLGSVAVNRAIASEFGFSTMQAEEYKKIYGVSDQNLGGKISKAMAPILTALIGEIKKALTFYAEKYQNESPVTQILLAGGTAKLPGIDLFFAQNVGIETVIVNPWRAHAVAGVPQEIDDRAPSYAVSVGLALKQYE